MKIGVKLVVVISIVNLIGIGLLAGVSLIQSQREISRMADGHAVDLAVQSGEKISKWFESHIGATRTLAQVIEGYKDIPITERRDYFNMMMKQSWSLIQNYRASMRIGRHRSWTAWTRTMQIPLETMRPVALYQYGVIVVVKRG